MTDRPENRNSGAPSERPEMQAAYQQPRHGGGNQRQGIAETAIKAFIRSIAGSLGRAITRAIVGRR